MTDLITIEQLPVIIAKLDEIEAAVKEKTATARSLAVTEDNKQTAKKIRAELNKEYERFENSRKRVEKEIMKPLDEFKTAYKAKVAQPYKAADEALKTKIAEIENGQKAEKEGHLRAYFEEYKRRLGNDYLAEIWKFEDLNLPINLSNSETKLQQMTADILEKSLNAYNALCRIENPYIRAEALSEYANTKNRRTAITTAHNRFDRQEKARLLAEQAERQKQAEERRTADFPQRPQPTQRIQEPLTAPKAEEPINPAESEEPVLKLRFTVTAQLSKLKALKEFLIKGDYQYE